MGKKKPKLPPGTWIERDMFTGIKGRYPLFCISPDLARLVKADDERDLTLTYKLIIRGMDA